MKNRIEFLKRKNIGKLKFNQFQNTLNVFKDLIYIDLERSTEILNNLIFSKECNDIVNETNDFQQTILKSVYVKLEDTHKSYIFTDDYQYCGLFLANTKEAIEKAFFIAKKDYNHTFFILDVNKEFFIRINYYDPSHNDFPQMYDITIKGNAVMLQI